MHTFKTCFISLIPLYCLLSLYACCVPYIYSLQLYPRICAYFTPALVFGRGCWCYPTCHLWCAFTLISLRSSFKLTYQTHLVAMQSILKAFDAVDDPTLCPVFQKRLQTMQGLAAHLKSARSCQWYKRGKLKELTLRYR